MNIQKALHDFERQIIEVQELKNAHKTMTEEPIDGERSETQKMLISQTKSMVDFHRGAQEGMRSILITLLDDY